MRTKAVDIMGGQSKMCLITSLNSQCNRISYSRSGIDSSMRADTERLNLSNAKCGHHDPSSLWRGRRMLGSKTSAITFSNNHWELCMLTGTQSFLFVVFVLANILPQSDPILKENIVVIIVTKKQLKIHQILKLFCMRLK